MLKKVAMLLSAAAIVNFSSEPIKALANEIQNTNVALISAENANLEKARVNVFDIYGRSELAAYDKVYKMDSSNIKSIGGNGGTYWGDHSFGNAIDGKLDTFWHTGKENSTSFKNEINISLTESTVLNRIVYAARQDSAKGKGFPEQFDIYASSSESGNDFKLVTTGSHITTGDLVEIEFKPTEFKRIKFVFKKASEEWASAAELWFYKEDPVVNKLKDLFTNGAMTELKPQYNSKTVIDSLNGDLQGHPLKSIYSEYIKAANELIVDKDKYKDRIMTLSQRGNEYTDQQRTKTAFAMYSFDPTGYYVTPGETIKVYVDAKEGDIMPTLVFAQGGNAKSSWIKQYGLKPGLNIITAETQIPAAIYFANKALKSEQAYAPKVRIEGGTKYPLYVEGKTDPVAFISELEEYLKKVSYNDGDFANGNPNGYHYNIAELSSDNNLISTTAAGAYNGLSDQYKKLGKTVSDTMKAWEIFYDDYAEFSGFDLTNETSENYRPRGKFNSRVFTVGSYGWASYGYTGYNGGDTAKRDNGWHSEIVKESMITKADWAIAHEWGHIYDNRSMVTHEATNNLYSLHMEDKYLEENRMVRENRWENQFTAYHNTKVHSDDVFFLLGVSYQILSVYGDEMYGEAQKIARLNEGNWISGLTNKECHAVALSKAIGKDITGHYEYFGVPISDKARGLVANLPKETKKTYYVNDKYMKKDATAFKDSNVKPGINVTKINNGNVKLDFTISEPDNSLLLYEVYRDGKYMGVTYSNTFTDKTAEAGKQYEYSVIAYDRKLNPSSEGKSSVKNIPDTIIKTSDITLSVQDKFNALGGVTATDSSNKDITSSIKVKSNNYVEGKAGVYTVVYTVTDKNGETVDKTRTITVKDGMDSLSSLNWKSATTGWGTIQKDKSIEGNPIKLISEDGKVIQYEKGIGTHANSKILYDIKDKGYKVFESYVGVDQEMANVKAASISFEVYLDGTKVFDSGLMKWNTPQKHVKVPLNNASELRLIVKDGGDGIGSDHGSWANASLNYVDDKVVAPTKITAPPIIEASDVIVSVKDKFDVLSGVTATDKSKEDITSSVKVKSSNYVEGKAGEYTVEYTVTDKNGITVNKTRTVTVKDGIDFLSDLNWKSAVSGWGTVQKDKSIEGNPIRLLLEDGQVARFEKGIGTHANSTIIYDIKGKGYKTFEAEVGVEQKMAGRADSSIIFEVYVDGERKFDSGLMKADTLLKRVSVDLNNASELKLVVKDGGNNIHSDHGNWANASLNYGDHDKENYEIEHLNK